RGEPVVRLQVGGAQWVVRGVDDVGRAPRPGNPTVEFLDHLAVATAQLAGTPPRADAEDRRGGLDVASRPVAVEVGDAAHLLVDPPPEALPLSPAEVGDPFLAEPGIELAGIKDAGTVAERDAEDGAAAATGPHYVHHLGPCCPIRLLLAHGLSGGPRRRAPST